MAQLMARLLRGTFMYVLTWLSNNVKTGRKITQYKGHKKSIECLKVHADTLYTGSADGTIRSWDVRLGTAQHIYKAHSSYILQLDVRNEMLISASQDGTLNLWKSKVISHVYDLIHISLTEELNQD